MSSNMKAIRPLAIRQRSGPGLQLRSHGYAKKGFKQPASGETKSKNFQRWLRLFKFIDDQGVPTCNWSTSGRSLMDFAQEIHAHLQNLGPYVSAKAIVRFLDNPEMLAHLHRKRTISLTTAQRWINKMDYR